MRSAIVNSIRQSIRQSIRGSGNPVPTFGLPLQNSLDTNIASTRATASYTRATTATSEDHQGKQVSVLSNEPRMIGSRRVRNLITASEDMTNGAYTAESGNVVIDSATQATWDGTNDVDLFQGVTITDDGSGNGGRTFTFSAYVKLISGTVSGDTGVELRLTGNAMNDTRQAIGSSLSTTESKRFYVTATTDAAGTTINASVEVDDAVTLEITKWQLEEVTGNITHAPSEYVSTGVGTGPELNTGVDGAGAENATAVTTGWTAFQNAVLSAAADGTASTGFHVEAESNSTPAAGANVSVDLDSYAGGLVVGKDYVLTAEYQHVGTGDAWVFGFGSDGTLNTDQVNIASFTTTSWTEVTYLFTYSSAKRYLGLREGNASNNGGARLSNISVKEADHGLNRDGVKAFPYHNGNTPAIRKFLDLDGTGDYASTPNPYSAAPTEIEVIAYLRPDDWNPVSTQGIVTHWPGGSNNAFIFRLTAGGNLQALVSADGSTDANSASTVATGFADGTGHWVRWTFSAAGQVSNYYTSDQPEDTAESDLSWSQLGDADVSHAQTSVYASTAAIAIGARNSGGSDPYAGQVMRAIVKDSIGGTNLVDFNAEDHTSGGTVTSSTTGEVWTFNADAFIDYEETGVVTEAQGPAINSSTSQWVELDGAAGNRVDTPSTSNVNQTGDFTFIFWVAPDDETPSAAQAIASNYNATGNQRGYLFRIGTGGLIESYVSTSGSDSPFAISTAAPEYGDGVGYWGRVDVSVTNSTGNFFTSQQPIGTALSDLSWTQLGDADVAYSASITGGLHASTADFMIGARDGGGATDAFAGKVARAVIISGSDHTATPVVDFNANDYEAGKTWEASGQQTEFVGTAAFDATDATDASTPDSTYTVSGNTVTGVVDGVSAIRYRHNGIATVAGKRYTVTVTESGSVNTTFQVGTTLGGTDILNTVASSASTSVFEFTATSATSYITLSVAGNFIVTFDSIIEHADIWTLNGTARVFSPFAAWGDFPGSSGDYFSTPDQALPSSGDIDAMFWVAPDDVDGGTQAVMGQYSSGGNVAWQVIFNSDGDIGFLSSNNGSTVVNSTSTVPVGFSDGVGFWGRVTWSPDTDVANYYTSADSYHTAYNKIIWEQLGDANVTHTDSALFNSGAVFEVGSVFAGAANVFAGKIGRAALMTSIGSGTPELDFDARTFTPGVTTATASTGEVWTAHGNVSIEQNIPSPWDASGPLGYLSEQAGTNLALYSTPGNLGTTWTDTNATPVANYAIAPDGTKTAVRLIDDGATGTGVVSLQQNLTVSSGASTYSWHVKADQLGMCVIRIENFDGTANGLSYFNMSTGAWGTVSSNHTVHDPVPTAYGYYRVAVTFTTTSDLAGTARIHVASTDGSTTVDLDGTSSILVWGAQVESGSFPTTYTPTGASSATRNADVLTYSAVGNADSFPMTVSAEYAGLDGSAVVLLSIDDETISNRWNVNLSSGRNPTLFSRASGTTDVQIVAASTVSQGASVKITAVVGSNDNELYLDGVSAGTDTASTPPVVTTIHVGSQWDGSIQPFATTRNLKIYNKRLNDSQVKNL